MKTLRELLTGNSSGIQLAQVHVRALCWFPQLQWQREWCLQLAAVVCQLLIVGSGSIVVSIGGGCVLWHEQLEWWSHKTIGSYCKNSVFDMMATVSARWAMLVLFTCCIISLTTVYHTYVRISAACDCLLCFDSSFPGEPGLAGSASFFPMPIPNENLWGHVV